LPGYITGFYYLFSVLKAFDVSAFLLWLQGRPALAIVKYPNLMHRTGAGMGWKKM
jgi:hypothetical protein